MIILYILGGLLALILLLLCLPVQIEVSYHNNKSGDSGDGVNLTVRYLFIPFQIIPKKTSEKNRFFSWFSEKHNAAKKRLASLRKRGKKAEKKTGTAEKRKMNSSFSQLREERGIGGMLSLLWRVVKLSGGAFGGILRGVNIIRFDFAMLVGGDNASDIAVSYGKWCAVLFPAFSRILGSVRKYRQNIRISPDFTAAESTVDAEIVFRSLPVLAVGHSIAAFAKLLWLEISDKVKEKVNESKNDRNIKFSQGGAVNG